MKHMPIDVSEADRAFAGKAMQILPKFSEIPDEFKTHHGTWQAWQAEWFFKGLNRYPVAKPGIDLHKAMANIACVQGSFEPKHEHKQAGVAYLASLWFLSPDGDQVKPS